MADRELALNLEPDDEEEDREQAVVDPLHQRHLKGCAAKRKAEWCFPKRGETRSERRVRQHDGQHGGEEQQHAGRGRPTREVERGRPHAMAQRIQDRISERRFVPHPFVLSAIDEKRMCEQHAARAGARRVGFDPRASPRPFLRWTSSRHWRQIEILLHDLQIVLRQ